MTYMLIYVGLNNFHTRTVEGMVVAHAIGNGTVKQGTSVPDLLFTKEVQQTQSLSLNFELIFPQFWKSEFQVSKPLIWVSLVNSE